MLLCHVFANFQIYDCFKEGCYLDRNNMTKIFEHDQKMTTTNVNLLNMTKKFNKNCHNHKHERLNMTNYLTGANKMEHSLTDGVFLLNDVGHGQNFLYTTKTCKI